MSEDKRTVWDRQTLTGKSLREVYAEIDKHMGDTAYKPVTIGGQSFTDIKPPYVYELMSDLFGPLGIGWGFEVTSAEYIGFRTYKSKSGKDATEHSAAACVAPWYRLADSEERYCWGPVTGGAKNSERQYAESGAITNALSKALSFLGVQRHIYKDSDPTMQPAEEEAAKLKAAYSDLITTAKQSGNDAALKSAMGDPADGRAAFAIFEAASEAERSAWRVVAQTGAEVAP